MAVTSEAAINDIIDKKFDKVIRAIKEVGFPIVLSSALIFIFYEWGDRLITTQEKFQEKLIVEIEAQTDEIKKQTENTNKILIAQERATLHAENQTKILEKQFLILEKRIEQAEKK